MKEVLLTSSVLILAVFLVRVLFQKAISRRVQYALWGLVLLRLLVPFQLPAMEHNVLTASAPVQATISNNLSNRAVYIPVDREPLSQHPDAPDASPAYAITDAQQEAWVIENDETAVQYRKFTGTELLKAVWITGMAIMAMWFLWSNISFYLNLYSEIPNMIRIMIRVTMIGASKTWHMTRHTASPAAIWKSTT